MNRDEMEQAIETVEMFVRTLDSDAVAENSNSFIQNLKDLVAEVNNILSEHDVR